MDKQLGRFLEVLKKLYINIPFTEALQQMPSYAKFLKDICSKKRKLEEYETVALTECSALIQNNYLQSLKTQAVSPFRVKLEMGELKPTTITLRLADRFVKYPIADFVVLEMEEDSQIPIILGRPFLATAGAIIDVKNHKLSLTVGDEKVEFDLSNAMKKPFVEGSCYMINMLQEVIIQEETKHYFKDPLELCLVRNNLNNDEDDEASEYKRLLEVQPYIQPHKAKIEELRSESSLSILEEEQAPKVELKPLPSILRYEFLGPNSTYPVIANANLSKVEIEKLLRELDHITKS
ncbi:uncharacterized protein LOC120265028 [Dioscorea cayenensis subsp. rotundata]|uniref:Uncharacterized protein LOC120265028 n=1 Tax=Dioscorea cayennensis subsp. rotundata TaxID=55577 RepID=A0AB40BN63_DIOCR|nr:uncharacterized protein LOC120265028 [Dioscorea cayenensis subsp. rotundata]